MKRAIVIGATSGIGRGLAEELAARGYRVGLVGRREALLREIAAADPAAYSCAVADVTQPDAALAALDGLVAVLDGLELCIVAAGTGDLNPDLDFTVEASAIHLVVISSVGGLRGSGAAPAYNASKAYQINYAEGLRQRVAKSGLPVTITDIRPGLVDTAMAKGEGLFWVQPVAKTVRQILRAVERRRHVAVVTRRWRIAAWLLRHLPESLYLKM